MHPLDTDDDWNSRFNRAEAQIEAAQNRHDAYRHESEEPVPTDRSETLLACIEVAESYLAGPCHASSREVWTYLLQDWRDEYETLTRAQAA